MFFHDHPVDKSDFRLRLQHHHVVVDTGATEYYLDSKLIPGLETMMFDFKALEVPKEIVTAGAHVLLRKDKGGVSGFTTGGNEDDHAAMLSCVIVPGLGRHVLRSTGASQRGIKTTIKNGHHRMITGDVALPLQQLPEDVGLCFVRSQPTGHAVWDLYGSASKR